MSVDLTTVVPQPLIVMHSTKCKVLRRGPLTAVPQLTDFKRRASFPTAVNNISGGRSADDSKMVLPLTSGHGRHVSPKRICALDVEVLRSRPVTAQHNNVVHSLTRREAATNFIAEFQHKMKYDATNGFPKCSSLMELGAMFSSPPETHCENATKIEMDKLMPLSIGKKTLPATPPTSRLSEKQTSSTRIHQRYWKKRLEEVKGCIAVEQGRTLDATKKIETLLQERTTRRREYDVAVELQIQQLANRRDWE